MSRIAHPVGVESFCNHLPVRVEFGDHVSRSLPRLLADHRVERVLVLADAGLSTFNPAVHELLQQLKGACRVTHHDKPAGEPTIEMIDQAIDALMSSDAQAVVALGGGSVIDTAKAARLCAQQGLTFREFLASGRDYPAPVVPLFALPTTAGTGSEVSGGAVVSDPAAGIKSGIAHPNLRAQYALVDPVLTHSCPPSTTAFAGVDALAQAIAAMVARSATPVGDAIALEAIRLISHSLVAAYRDGSSGAARSDVACGSMMAGLAMNISDCTAEHSLGQAIGGLFHAPHGLTVGLVLAETLERERRHVPHTLERVADAMGVPDDGSRDGTRAVSAVLDVLGQLDFPVLSSLGVTHSHVDELTEMALQDYFITESPSPWSADDVREAFTRALAVTAR